MNNPAAAQVVIQERIDIAYPTALPGPGTSLVATGPADACEPPGSDYVDLVSGGETSQTAKVKGSFVFIPYTAHVMGGELEGTFEVINETRQTTTRFSPIIPLSDRIENAACHRTGEASRKHTYSVGNQEVRVPVEAGDRIRVRYLHHGLSETALFARYNREVDGVTYRVMEVDNACNCCSVCGCFLDPDYVWVRITTLMRFESEKPARFDVSFERDTLALGDGAALRVQAVDEQGFNVPFEDDVGVYLSLSTTKYGSFFDSVTGTRAAALDAYRYGDAKRWKVRYIADGNPGMDTTGRSAPAGATKVTASAVPVRVQVAGCELSGEGAVWVTPTLDHFDLRFGSDPLRHKKVSAVFVQAKDAYGNDIDVPDETQLTFALEQGANLGTMRQSLSQPGKTVLTTTYGSVRSKSSDASGVVFRADGTNPVGWEQAARRVRISVTAVADPSATGADSLEVLGDYQILMKVSPDTVLHQGEAVLQVQAVDDDGLPVSLPDSLPVDFELGQSSIEYGSLHWTGQQGVRISDVPYANARAWEVRFMADGERPLDRKNIAVYASISYDQQIISVVNLVIRGSRWDLVHFVQGDSTWGKNMYDTSKRKKRKEGQLEYFTISEKGCALTAMAMILRGAGVDVDPGRLNEWMVNENGYSGSDVRWSTPQRYAPEKIKYERIEGDSKNMRNGQTVSLNSMDSHLDSGHLLIAQVRNPKSGGQHWVLVTGKNGAAYVIYDPATRKRKTLDEYSNNVYRFVVYSQM